MRTVGGFFSKYWRPLLASTWSILLFFIVLPVRWADGPEVVAAISGSFYFLACAELAAWVIGFVLALMCKARPARQLLLVTGLFTGLSVLAVVRCWTAHVSWVDPMTLVICLPLVAMAGVLKGVLCGAYISDAAARNLP